MEVMKKAPRRKAWARNADYHRERLYSRNPHCHWCGVRTIPGKGGGSLLATLDHVKSWPECSSLDEWADQSNMVLACLSCNQRRSHEWCLKNQSPKKWQAYLAKQTLAGHYPLIAP